MAMPSEPPLGWEQELAKADKTWGPGKVRSVLNGWRRVRTLATDRGKPELMLDCIQLEQAVKLLTDETAKAALVMVMGGASENAVDEALGSRKRPGFRLIRDGIHGVVEIERRRAA